MSDFQIIVRGPRGTLCNVLTSSIEQLVDQLIEAKKPGWGAENAPTVSLHLTYTTEGASTQEPGERKQTEMEAMLEELLTNPGNDASQAALVSTITEAVNKGEEGHTEPMTSAPDGVADLLLGTSMTIARNAMDPAPGSTLASAQAYINEKRTLDDILPGKLRGGLNNLDLSGISEADGLEKAGAAESFEELSKHGEIEPPDVMPPVTDGLVAHLAVNNSGGLSSVHRMLLATLLDFDLVSAVLRPASPPELKVVLNTGDKKHHAILSEIFADPELNLVYYFTKGGDVVSAQHLTSIVLGDLVPTDGQVALTLYVEARREADSLELAVASFENKSR